MGCALRGRKRVPRGTLAGILVRNRGVREDGLDSAACQDAAIAHLLARLPLSAPSSSLSPPPNDQSAPYPACDPQAERAKTVIETVVQECLPERPSDQRMPGRTLSREGDGEVLCE
jgi:hypothetical protein